VRGPEEVRGTSDGAGPDGSEMLVQPQGSLRGRTGSEFAWVVAVRADDARAGGGARNERRSRPGCDRDAGAAAGATFAGGRDPSLPLCLRWEADDARAGGGARDERRSRPGYDRDAGAAAVAAFAGGRSPNLPPCLRWAADDARAGGGARNEWRGRPGCDRDASATAGGCLNSPRAVRLPGCSESSIVSPRSSELATRARPSPNSALSSLGAHGLTGLATAFCFPGCSESSTVSPRSSELATRARPSPSGALGQLMGSRSALAAGRFASPRRSVVRMSPRVLPSSPQELDPRRTVLWTGAGSRLNSPRAICFPRCSERAIIPPRRSVVSTRAQLVRFALGWDPYFPMYSSRRRPSIGPCTDAKAGRTPSDCLRLDGDAGLLAFSRVAVLPPYHEWPGESAQVSPTSAQLSRPLFPLSSMLSALYSLRAQGVTELAADLPLSGCSEFSCLTAILRTPH
jgi:hypothetical protein